MDRCGKDELDGFKRFPIGVVVTDGGQDHLHGDLKNRCGGDEPNGFQPLFSIEAGHLSWLTIRTAKRPTFSDGRTTWSSF